MAFFDRRYKIEHVRNTDDRALTLPHEKGAAVIPHVTVYDTVQARYHMHV